jgi:hypothetical protein
MNPSLCGEVVDIEVEAEYQGVVYTRTVSIRVDSMTLDCFQDRGHVTEEDIGERVNVVLLAQPVTDYQVSCGDRACITQSEASDKNESRWHTKIEGKIEKVGEYIGDNQGTDERYVFLDVGDGSVLIPLTKELKNKFSDGGVDVGMSLRLESGRIDIIGRNDL